MAVVTSNSIYQEAESYIGKEEVRKHCKNNSHTSHMDSLSFQNPQTRVLFESEHGEELKTRVTQAMKEIGERQTPLPFKPKEMTVMVVGTEKPTSEEAIKTLENLGFSNIIREDTAYKALDYIRGQLNTSCGGNDPKGQNMTLFGNDDINTGVDIVLAPMNIQDMKGLDFAENLSEVCQQYGGKYLIRGIPVIMMSSSEGVGSIERVVSQGAHEILVAPFTKELLQYRVESLLLSVHGARVADICHKSAVKLHDISSESVRDRAALRIQAQFIDSRLSTESQTSLSLQSKLEASQQEIRELKTRLQRTPGQSPFRRPTVSHDDEAKQKATQDELARAVQQIDILKGQVALLESESKLVKEENETLLESAESFEREMATVEERESRAVENARIAEGRTEKAIDEINEANANLEHTRAECTRLHSAIEELKRTNGQLERRAADLSRQKIQLMRSAVVAGGGGMHHSQSVSSDRGGKSSGDLPSFSNSADVSLESPRSPISRPVSPIGSDIDEDLSVVDVVKQLPINPALRVWLLKKVSDVDVNEEGVQTDVFDLPDSDTGATHVHHYAHIGDIDALSALISLSHKTGMALDVGARTQRFARSPLHLVGYSGLEAKVEKRLAQLKESDQSVDGQKQARRAKASPAAIQREFRARRMKDNDQIVELLVSEGADANVRDSNHDSPLHIAIHALDVPTSKCLIKHGADPDVSDAHGRTPLYLLCAAECAAYVPVSGSEPLGVPELTAALLQAGADPHRHASNGVTPHEAARRRDTKPLLTLLRKHTIRKGEEAKSGPADINVTAQVDGVSVLPLPLAPGVQLARDILPKRTSPLWQWSFDSQSLESPDEMASVAVDLFHALGVCDTFRIPLRTLTRCLKGLPPRGYHSSTEDGPGDRDVGFNNDFSIALDTLQAVFLLLTRYGAIMHLAPTDTLALCVSAMFYRANRPRYSNEYQRRAGTELCGQYNEQHILENNSIDFAFEYLSDPDMNIFSHMSEASFKECRSSLIDLIIASDTAVRSVIILELENRLLHIEQTPWSSEDTGDRRLLTRALFHLACSSTPLRGMPHSNTLLEAEYNENVMEGEMTRYQFGVEPSERYRRYPDGLAKLALVRIDDCCVPIIEHLSVLLPVASEMVEKMRMERLKWLSEQDEMVKAWMQREEKKKAYVERLQRLQREKEEREHARIRIMEPDEEETEFMPALGGALTLRGRNDTSFDIFDQEVANVQQHAHDRRRVPHHPPRPHTSMGAVRVPGSGRTLIRSKTVLGTSSTVSTTLSAPNTRMKVPPPDQTLRRPVSSHSTLDPLSQQKGTKVRPKTSMGTVRHGRHHTRNLMLISQQLERKEKQAALATDVAKAKKRVEVWGTKRPTQKKEKSVYDPGMLFVEGEHKL